MADKLSPQRRSEVMSAVKGKNTTPELRVRRVLHAMGYRFRLHRKDLPGKPDIVLPKYKLCIFVHGCFWHQHSGCKRATMPASNKAFWKKKLTGNFERDKKNTADLKSLGWQVCIIWECETKQQEVLEKALSNCLALKGY
ncbi:very short patch repair endonuclease [Sulfuriflexus mobilis]|uniref:very short patch repair endonuclease n=1 Tax=Sulfuriflexus mobilis TaxID=1811807 RepID=UPI000F827B12|nr:very short patch repair endonuclease [Sulfuriflexus mobilis]